MADTRLPPALYGAGGLTGVEPDRGVRLTPERAAKELRSRGWCENHRGDWTHLAVPGIAIRDWFVKEHPTTTVVWADRIYALATET